MAREGDLSSTIGTRQRPIAEAPEHGRKMALLGRVLVDFRFLDAEDKPGGLRRRPMFRPLRLTIGGSLWRIAPRLGRAG